MADDDVVIIAVKGKRLATDDDVIALLKDIVENYEWLE